ncbi:hypothetical protein BDR04DRAFT_1103148 [Suillus decipiens]|nr:hypothetical protein BDR04DRAFT_1103148 [Suillus decipiens]
MSMLFTIPGGNSLKPTQLLSLALTSVVQVKERLDVHHRVIAWEVSYIVHAGTYTKQKRCEEDWKELWWNRIDIGFSRLSNTSRNSTSGIST